MKPPPNPIRAVSAQLSLSTKIIAALAIALFPMGAFAVILAVRSSEAFGSAPPTWVQLLSVFMPVFMWIGALLTAWFAIHRLVVKPLILVQRHMEKYGQSSDDDRASMRLGNKRHGSNELAALAGTFDAMADEIDQHSLSMCEALDEQQRLTREVHHRVKNNLQIVSSLLSLQTRAANSVEVAQTCAVIQARINALTQVHRWMYDDTTNDGVNLQSLLYDLCSSLEMSLVTPDHVKNSIACHSDVAVIHPDVAVPVAFLVTELANLAAQHNSSGPIDIDVTAVNAGAQITISVAAAAFDGVDHIAGDKMAPNARIIHGMARQLRSVLQHHPMDNCYAITFAPNPP